MPRQDKEVTRSRIEDATIKLFATHSYHSISMDEIASKACISKRTLYKYYPSKAQLFISIFEQNLRQLDAENALLESREDVKGKSFSDILIGLFTALYEFTDKHRQFMELFWMLNSDTLEKGTSEEVAGHILQLNNRIMEKSAKLLEESTPTGIFKDMSPILITQFYSAINKGIFLQAEKEARIGIDIVTQDDLYQTACSMLRHCAEEM